MHVQVRNNNVNAALKLLKRKVSEEGTLLALRGKEFYEKPSIKKHRAEGAARFRERKRTSAPSALQTK